ncbi:MAG: ECF-type sigma factor [Phycisphaerales bacterium JB039]
MKEGPLRSAIPAALSDVSRDDDDRVTILLPLVYDQLRAIAQRAMASERPDHSLQATALVHEAYLRLVGDREVPWSSKAHFYVAAAEAMRRILIDHARRKGRRKRGGGRPRMGLQSVADLATEDAGEVLRFDAVFRRLEAESAEAAAVVRLRFYAGLTIDQTAAALGVSPNTVDRRWAFARAWLFRAMREGGGEA